MSYRPFARRLPVGADCTGATTSFRVWAPDHARVDLLLAAPGQSETRIEMTAEGNGYFSLELDDVSAGALYRFAPGGAEPCADPAARFQPDGPTGWSEVIDPAAFPWTDHDWQGITTGPQAIYEMHIGTFTSEGTWAAATERLATLADLGVTVLELMPVADFTGRFGWGYDGASLFAPCRHYGRPDDFRRFVDRAHRLGLGVILDVVYNHIAPRGSMLKCFADAYRSARHTSEWGDCLNYDGDDSQHVREFVLSNVRHWITEYHLDGLRVDATQDVRDCSTPHILSEIVRTARDAAGGRRCLLVAENEPQQADILRPVEAGGYGFDMVWSEDFHHTAMVAVTGRRRAYFSDHRGTPQELVSACKNGFLFQGQRYAWQNNPRGTPVRGTKPARFVGYLQNHDQIANTGFGYRLHHLTSRSRLRAITALTVLAPITPHLFQGQEFTASAPFHYFADPPPESGADLIRGRHQALAQFPELATDEARATMPSPLDPATFASCRLNWAERAQNDWAVRLHRDLLTLRRSDPVISVQERHDFDGAVIGPDALVLRWFGEGGHDRLLLVNLGRDLAIDGIPEPLIAPRVGADWRVLWASEAPSYGGGGLATINPAEAWVLLGESAVLLASYPVEPKPLV